MLEFAEAHTLRVREGEHTHIIEVPKGDLLFEVTVMKDEDVMEWFLAAKESSTRQEAWSGWFDTYAVEGESHEELLRELDAAGVTLLDALLRYDVRLINVKSEPLFRIFGWTVGAWESTRLQLNTSSGWQEWDELL